MTCPGPRCEARWGSSSTLGSGEGMTSSALGGLKMGGDGGRYNSEIGDTWSNRELWENVADRACQLQLGPNSFLT